MKKIIGLDLGTTSIGWAVVNEAESKDEISSIVKLGVRVNPLTGDEQKNFEQGKSITTNAERTLKRSARRNLQRYKLRRDNLIEILLNNNIITDQTILSEQGNYTTFQTYRLRAKAATEKIMLEEFARVLLMINKKRGYRSSRNVKSNDGEGQFIDGMSIALQLYENNYTPGQLSLLLLREGKKYLPDFYRSDLQTELDSIWDFQKQFYPEILTTEFKEQIRNKGKQNTSKIFLGKYQIFTADNKGKDKRLQTYLWRVNALKEQLSIEELAYVISDVNGSISNSSGYLGEISDRSKELYFNKQTVGEFLISKLDNNPNYSLKNQVFYRQDYLDEFEKLWETQALYHPELTPELKKVLRDVIIFYQRPLKSQKGLIGFCEFESKQIEVVCEGKKKLKTVGCRVCPKSSPLFQEFKIWQVLNSVQVSENSFSKRFLEQEEKERLFAELNWRDKLTKAEVLQLLYTKSKGVDLNYKEIEGNRTQAALLKIYLDIIERSGHDKANFSKISMPEVINMVKSIFQGLGYNTDILSFKSELEGKDFENQPMYRLWHLLYSFEGDDSKTGNEKLIDKLTELYGFEREYAVLLANISFQPDYGSLSTKAMRKILPFLKGGNEYSLACEYAGYRHSKRSLTKEELNSKIYKDRLELLPRNSLRNPVVEKILNQMINVVNMLVETYGKPDEIRIELARELKKSAKERENMTLAIRKSTSEYEEYRAILQQEFGLINVSRNDIIRYKLYLELKENGYKTLYSNTYISREKLFSKEFDIEHIIPQAKLFDDSFSNKTLESRSVNIAKSNATAYDYVKEKDGEQGVMDYVERINKLFQNGSISKSKRDKLLMEDANIPNGFIERDLRDSQYIARKAREILEDLVKFVIPTTGIITDRLREDWQLINILQELNWDKYNQLGLTDIYEDKDGRKIRCIKDWTKRNDHRHHAMDALTIAFTKQSIIQYLNNLNARSDKTGSIYGIEQNELYRDSHGKLRFNPPMPLNLFRAEAKKQLEDILVSIKAKNKVVTQNINKVKKKEGYNKKIQLTPRGQLHNETIYGSIKRYLVSVDKVGANFNSEQIAKVANKKYQKALLLRLTQFGNDPKKAFTGKNGLEKNPIYLDEHQTIQVPLKVKTVSFETIYTIRKEITPDLKLDKIVDFKIRRILEARLLEFKGNAKQAFSNLKENPIWLNKEKGIAIKRVTISGVSNAVALHDKRDHNGHLILDEKGRKQAADYISPSNNHHVAIYQDANGVLQENVVSFFEVTSRVSLGLPIIDKEYKKSEGWIFLFSMKQNEYFVFPNKETGFEPNETDLLDPDNYAQISLNLFRVQTISKVSYGSSVIRDYKFRHHLETSVKDNKDLKDITFKQFKSLDFAKTIVKVRVNHIGQIVAIGEY
ncbi:type II CRISPR RNA-guided endonuclease Cas9 [uncultured Parabacteroides sp.]|uniref:type II CRISPR RNA-guided endonuclease Cas9 n=1 Tax=uncultured Parabacteroides sp. TaxID=512312 RepID=UPI002592DFDF|nr:type II CRISPR RNA-guided endonuclease Cas9 [uncultured Parabacteroides sp.]